MKSGDIFDEDFCARRGIDRGVLEHVVVLAIELAREGREGRKVGALFVVGDHEAVLERSRPLILDPLFGHPAEAKHITDPNVKETLKELSQLDGAFVISAEGEVISACRYLNASSVGITLPMGLGSRHMAAASITAETDAVAVVASESSMVRIFDDGELISEIIPELWLFGRRGKLIRGPCTPEVAGDLTIVTRDEG